MTPDLEKLTELRDALRRPLPKNHRFDIRTYVDETSCGTVCCAVGLGIQLGILTTDIHAFSVYTDSRLELGLSVDEYGSLFMPIGYFPEIVKSSREVTPEMVADKIDAFVKEKSNG